MTGLAGQSGQIPSWEALETHHGLIFKPNGPDATAQGSDMVKWIHAAHLHFRTLSAKQQIPSGTPLSQEDLTAINDAAETLLDDPNILNAWLGTNQYKRTATTQTVTEYLNQLKRATGSKPARRQLNALIKEQPVRTGLVENELVSAVVAQLKTAQPHFNAGKKLEQVLPNAEQALEATYTAVRKHNSAVPALTLKTPSASSKTKRSAQALLQETEQLLGADTQPELDTLLETREVATSIKGLKATLETELEQGDFAPVTVRKHETALRKSDEFCQACQKKVAPHMGSTVFTSLHTDGRLDEAKVTRIQTQLEQLSQRELQQVQAQEVVLSDVESASVKVLKHDRTTRMMTGAMPEGVIELLEKIRLQSFEDHQKLMHMIKSQQMTDDLAVTLDAIHATVAERRLINQLVQGTIKITTPGTSAGKVPLVTEDGDFDLTAYLIGKADEQSAGARMTAALQYLNQQLPELEMQQGALILKDAVLQKGARLDSFPHNDLETVKAHLRTLYPSTELSDEQLDNSATYIVNGMKTRENGWEVMTQAVNDMPVLEEDLLKSSVKQLRAMSTQQAEIFLRSHDAFKKWIRHSEQVNKMVSLVRSHQLSVADLEEIRNTGIRSPRAATMLAMSADDVVRFRDKTLMPDDVWNDIIEAVKSPAPYSAGFVTYRTSINIASALYAFIWEFFIDDMTRFGGTGSIAILLGAADKQLEEVGIPKEMVMRTMLIYLEEYITSPDGQKLMAKVSPLFGIYQVNRVRKDVFDLIVTKEMSTATGQGMSVVFLLLTWLNELAWGGPLTHQMVLVARGLDSVIQLQQHLKAYIKDANTQFRYGKISSDELYNILQQSISALDLIDETNPHWEDHIDNAIALLRGRVPDEDLNKLQHEIHHGYQYRRIARGWHNMVDWTSETLAPWRPVTTVIGGSFPKALLARGILHPALLWGASGFGKSFPPLAIPSRLMLGGVLSSTGFILGMQLLYDGIYNDFDSVRETFYPVVNKLDRAMGIDFEKAAELGMTPYSFSKTLNDTTRYLSFSAPGNVWTKLLNMPAYLMDKVISNDPNSEHSLTYHFDRTVTRTLLGHQHSFIGSAAKSAGFTALSATGTSLGYVVQAGYQAYLKMTGTATPTLVRRKPGLQFDLKYSEAYPTHFAGNSSETLPRSDKKKGEYQWVSAGGKSRYRLRTDKVKAEFKSGPGPLLSGARSSFEGSFTEEPTTEQMDEARRQQKKEEEDESLLF